MAKNISEGNLFIVSVPIGNINDITERAKAILSSADFIACEDTRITGKLLDKLILKSEDHSFPIEKKMKSY